MVCGSHTTLSPTFLHFIWNNSIYDVLCLRNYHLDYPPSCNNQHSAIQEGFCSPSLNRPHIHGFLSLAFVAMLGRAIADYTRSYRHYDFMTTLGFASTMIPICYTCFFIGKWLFSRREWIIISQ